MNDQELNNVHYWGESTPNTQNVTIGAPQYIDCEELTAIFDACIVEYQMASTISGIIQRQHCLTVSRDKIIIPAR